MFHLIALKSVSLKRDDGVYVVGSSARLTATLRAERAKKRLGKSGLGSPNSSKWVKAEEPQSDSRGGQRDKKHLVVSGGSQVFWQ